MTFNYQLLLLERTQPPQIPMQEGGMVENPNLKENEEGRSDLLEILTNQPSATPPALSSSGGYDQPEAKIGNNLRKKKKVRRRMLQSNRYNNENGIIYDPLFILSVISTL